MWFLITASVYPCVYLSGESFCCEPNRFAANLIGLQLTKKFLYCMEPELSLPCTILKNKIEILRFLKSGKTGFKNFNTILRI